MAPSTKGQIRGHPLRVQGQPVELNFLLRFTQREKALLQATAKKTGLSMNHLLRQSVYAEAARAGVEIA